MTPLLILARQMFHANPVSFLRGAALGVIVLAMGALLLGLSGWFVTASAAAGVAGVGIGFDFFRPSAGVRFLALGRAGGRYGERMLTHDATLHALAALRGRLYRGITRLPYEDQSRLRGADALNRLTSDVDALDGVLLRLILPVISVTLVMVGAFVLLWWLVALPVAIAVVVGFGLGGGLALAVTAIGARKLAETDETQLQDLRAHSLDLMQSRADLAMAGALGPRADDLTTAVAQAMAGRDALEQVDRRGGAVLSATTAITATAALFIGTTLAIAGTITPATAAIGFFAALALAEGIAVLRRGLAELGRMQSAADRIVTLSNTPAGVPAGTIVPPSPAMPSPKPAPVIPRVPGANPVLEISGLSYQRAGAARPTFAPLSFCLNAGQTLLVNGPSGAGKSTLLSIIAGLLPLQSGQVHLFDRPLAQWPEPELRRVMTLVPQRSALVSGTVRENLALACPDDVPFDGDTAWACLDALGLGPALRARDGLETRLGAGGSGLSGGQARRLCLARAVLRRPRLMMLDEPTEGLDRDSADQVLSGLRHLLPDTAILMVSHRPEDIPFADAYVTIKSAT